MALITSAFGQMQVAGALKLTFVGERPQLAGAPVEAGAFEKLLASLESEISMLGRLAKSFGDNRGDGNAGAGEQEEDSELAQVGGIASHCSLQSSTLP